VFWYELNSMGGQTELETLPFRECEDVGIFVYISTACFTAPLIPQQRAQEKKYITHTLLNIKRYSISLNHRLTPTRESRPLTPDFHQPRLRRLVLVLPTTLLTFQHTR
jgi:hypothetical protein